MFPREKEKANTCSGNATVQCNKLRVTRKRYNNWTGTTKCTNKSQLHFPHVAADGNKILNQAHLDNIRDHPHTEHSCWREIPALKSLAVRLFSNTREPAPNAQTRDAPLHSCPASVAGPTEATEASHLRGASAAAPTLTDQIKSLLPLIPIQSFDASKSKALHYCAAAGLHVARKRTTNERSISVSICQRVDMTGLFESNDPRQAALDAACKQVQRPVQCGRRCKRAHRFSRRRCPSSTRVTLSDVFYSGTIYVLGEVLLVQLMPLFIVYSLHAIHRRVWRAQVQNTISASASEWNMYFKIASDVLVLRTRQTVRTEQYNS